MKTERQLYVTERWFLLAKIQTFSISTKQNLFFVYYAASFEERKYNYTEFALL